VVILAAVVAVVTAIDMHPLLYHVEAVFKVI
jgi:hypothetical protein